LNVGLILKLLKVCEIGQKCSGNFVGSVFVRWNMCVYLGSCHMVAVTFRRRKEAVATASMQRV
jgi:hypothetical protein